MFASIQYVPYGFNIFPTVSNVLPASVYETSSDLVISSWNLLTEPDNPVQLLLNNVVIDSRKTESKAVASFRLESTNTSEAVLASAENSKASSNVGGQSALTATCSHNHLGTEQGKYDTCDKISRQTRLSEEPKTINGVKLPFKCQHCSAHFSSKTALVRHEKHHSGKYHFTCETCGVGFHKNKDLTHHKKIHSPASSFLCKMCNLVFERKDKLTLHTRTHTGERPFECKECYVTFSQKSNLDKHRLVHDDTRTF